MHYIKGFFAGEVPDWVHDRFIRYGRGTFAGPKIAVKTKKDVKISATIEYSNILAELLAKNSAEPLKVSGSVFAKRDIGQTLKDFLKVSKSKFGKGLYSAEVSGEVSADEFTGLCGMIPDAMLLLDVSGGGQKISCKKKKLPKPGSGIEESFCTGTLGESALDEVKNELLFDASGDFNEAEATHEIVIDELVKPSGVTDAARLRVEAKRKGKIKRTLTLDGKKQETEANLLA